MTTLIEKLEAAGEGSRLLDAQIVVDQRICRDADDRDLPEWAGKNFPTWRPLMEGGLVEVVHEDGDGGLHWAAPYFTTSYDGAVSLFPEGWFPRVEPRFFDPKRVTYRGYGIRPRWDDWSPVDEDWFDFVEALDLATPELALAAAALKAREGE